MARVSRKRKQEQAVEKLAVSRDEVYQCAVYIRLSKEENEKSDSHKLDNQEQVILNYVRKNSDLKIVKIYCDNGYSGTNFSRAAFGEMMQDIKSGMKNTLIGPGKRQPLRPFLPIRCIQVIWFRGKNRNVLRREGIHKKSKKKRIM